ncbi:hypothetical protein [Acidianus sulfidivorans]|uniref:hypothetical protein n=1 Tax=Acidianus sulfidivorans TaxID=312539 RepID=UPI0013A58F7F|nr:hypothetical protein [Acidianus sulfidivorans]
MPRKERKFYFIDPFIYEAFSDWVMIRKLDENKITEAVIVSHLSRIFLYST